MPEAKQTNYRRPVSSPRSSAPMGMQMQSPEPDEFSDFGQATVLPRQTSGSMKKMKMIIIFVIIILAAGAAGYLFSNPSALKMTAKTSKYHAVFLTNGQVYFGTIKSESRDNIILDNVYYVKMVDQQVPPSAEGEQPKTVQTPQLVKNSDDPVLAAQILRINRNQVTVIEELSESSQILQQIRQGQK